MRKDSARSVSVVFAWATLTFVVLVSSYDSFRCVTDQRILYDVELNPICRLLIAWGGVALLVGVKTFTNAGLAAYVAYSIRGERMKAVWFSLTVLAVAQAVVMAGYWIQ